MSPLDKSFDDLYSPPSYVGHVASVAVHRKFRGHGVAQGFMQCLHYKLAKSYHVDKVTLYCRVGAFYFQLQTVILILFLFPP